MDILDSDGKINRIGYPEYFVVAIEKRIFIPHMLDIFRCLSFSFAFVKFLMKPSFSNHTTGKSDDKRFILFFRESPSFADISIHPIFSLLSYGTAIKYKYISFITFEDFSESSLKEYHIYFFGIRVVHLATESLEKVIHVVKRKIKDNLHISKYIFRTLLRTVRVIK